jgi:negative regulator of flagellin synthesis FlgM
MGIGEFFRQTESRRTNPDTDGVSQQRRIPMKVNGEHPSITSTFYQNQISAAQSRTNRKSGHYVSGVADDKVQLSDQARQVKEAADTLAKLPDVREKKVQQVKMEVEAGTYNVSGQKVAMDMLKESFENNMVLSQIDIFA